MATALRRRRGRRVVVAVTVMVPLMVVDAIFAVHGAADPGGRRVIAVIDRLEVVRDHLLALADGGW